jgi:signal transduction histidine kinase
MKNWAMDLLKYQAFPELANAVRQCKREVIDRWEAMVRELLPAANELTVQDIRNSLPDTIEQMAAALEADEPRATKDLMELANIHGESRFDQNFNLSELMIEYSLLRPILIGQTAEQLGREPTVKEVQALNLAVDVSCRRGVITYVNQQKAELHALVEAQTKYLAFLSHDLRGGLNGVLLMIEVLKRDLVEEPKFARSLEDLDVMRRQILETVGTMDRFLHAERFRKGKVQIRPGDVNLRRLVEEIVAQFAYQAKDKQLELQTEVSEQLRIVSDRELLSMILQNLLGNAIKYSRRERVRVVATSDGPGKAARLSVIDHGPGIAPEKLTQMFQPFNRGETHGQAGTGLGLSIARQAADLLGAKLWAESELGKGSAFHLDLPEQPPTSATLGAATQTPSHR